jgi:hypothetical protein
MGRPAAISCQIFRGKYTGLLSHVRESGHGAPGSYQLSDLSWEVYGLAVPCPRIRTWAPGGNFLEINQYGSE